MRFGRSGKYLVALLACVAFGAAQAQPAASAEPKFKWLCKPGRANDPCQTSLRTETVSKDESLGFSTPKALTRLRNKVDCFYVYPTVSSQPGSNADLTKGPEISGIAEQQAARFAPGCRMFAPIYRQYTIAAIFGSQITEETSEIAYGSVKAAWNEYLRKYNKGRGIVLIGHSQGTGHLEQLISETFDRKPNLRKRLVSAVLIGGNVIVRKGKRTGGSFNRVPACARATELGCVIAFSSFLKDPPPEEALFGRLGGALADPGFDPSTHEVMCVNPARLDGSKGALKPLYNTATFPGLYGPLLPDLTGYEASWVRFPNLYRASCRKADGASWLDIRDVSTGTDPRPRIGEPLGREWGSHLTEVNDTAGNLVRVVTSQEKAYLKRIAKQKRKRR
ncbi:MAG: hypothetical protein QG596_222 [Actinomycetota bacterium]|nr:hypothetical protein [Actinomycetota bacterium]